MKLLLAATLLVLTGANNARAQAAQVDGIEIIERGIFDQTEIVQMGIVPAPIIKTQHYFSAALVKANVVAEIKLFSDTSIIPARPGIHFGIRYIIIGNPGSAPVNIRLVIRYPEEGVRNIKTGKILYQTEAVQSKRIGGLSYSGDVSDDEWEMTRGTWLIELWYQDRKLGEQPFTIISPPT